MKVDRANKFKDNPRQITGDQFQMLKKHLEQLGDLSGVVYCTKQKAYLGGNMRSEVMHGADIEIVERFNKPTKNKTLAYGFIHYNGEKFAYREVAFNKREFDQACIVANSNGGTWDWDRLGNEWEAADLVEWGLDVPDFEAVEPESADAEPQIDKAAELNKKWKVKAGDLWQIGSHRLVCGDSTDVGCVSRLMDGERAVLMVSDPPYNVKYDYDSIDDNQDAAAYAAFCDAYMVAGQSVSQMQVITPGKANERLYDYTEYMTWFKGFGLSRGSFYKAMVTEPILLFGEKPTNKFYATDHFHFGTDREEGLRDLHTCPKPKELFAALIEPMTEIGEVVYEAFAGSGTTLVACQNLNRKCYAIEISENYCAVILERMQTAFPDIEIKRIEQAEVANA
jgi:DNA modification methylase